MSSMAAVLIQAGVAGFTMLAGVMAVGSGSIGFASFRGRRSPDELQYAINRGAMWGFVTGVPLAFATVILLLAQ